MQSMSAIQTATAGNENARFINPRNGDMLLSSFEAHLQLGHTTRDGGILHLLLRPESDPSAEVPLHDIDTQGNNTVRFVVQVPEDVQAGYYDLLARLGDEKDPIASTSVRKMPYGATRSKAALCYTAGLGMRSEILTENKLRSVPADSIRDASKPAITAEIESDTHDREPPAPRGDNAFFYKPVEGSTLERNFTIYFVDPTALDQEVTLHLQSNIDGEGDKEGILLLETKMDGNRLRQRVDLPKDTKPGDYSLTVRRAGLIKASLMVKVAST